jgi:sulfite exporter TauE/SafE
MLLAGIHTIILLVALKRTVHSYYMCTAIVSFKAQRASHIHNADVSADVSNSRATDATAASGYRYSTAAAVGTAAAGTAVAAATINTKELTSRLQE